MIGRGVIYICTGLFFTIFLLTPSSDLNARSDLEINIFLPGANSNISIAKNFENELGVNFKSLKWYQDWPEAIDTSVAKRFHDGGYIPELTWQPQNISYEEVVQGNSDAYLAQSAQLVKSLGFELRISLAPEMNTDWVSWGIGKNGNNNVNHIAFWQYVVNIFRQNGANNVSWIWSPNVTPWNSQYSFREMYPGDQFVDYLGLDGYNWGTSQSWSKWQTFSEVFSSSYSELCQVSSKPILIMEVASSELGGNKAIWINEMFEQLDNQMTRIKGFTWFNINKESDWRINSSSFAQESFIANVHGGKYSSKYSDEDSQNSSANNSINNSINEQNSSKTESLETATSFSDPTVLVTDEDNQKKIKWPLIESSKMGGNLLEEVPNSSPTILLTLLLYLFSGILLFNLGYLTSRVFNRYQVKESPPIRSRQVAKLRFDSLYRNAAILPSNIKRL